MSSDFLFLGVPFFIDDFENLSHLKKNVGLFALHGSLLPSLTQTNFSYF